MGGIKKEYLPILMPSISTSSPASSIEKKKIFILGAAVSAFAAIPEISPIVIAIPEGQESAAKAALPPGLLSRKDLIVFVHGGPTRRSSVHKALAVLERYNPQLVLIHDGARPWVEKKTIKAITEAAIRYGAAVPVLNVLETPKELGASGDFIGRHLRREKIITTQTPQGFRFPDILRAHEMAAEREKNENFEYTDDAEVWGEFMGQVVVVPGDAKNVKITYSEDLKKGKIMQRIGIGRDIHLMARGRKFLLGGVEIPSKKGEIGHSDGDVLAHAVCDALLGAAGLGDTGELYPPGDPAFKDANSLELLKKAWEKARAKEWRLVNLDCTIICETPKILPYRSEICRSLAKTLDVDPELIFVKGKTNEGLGPLGSGKAVEALAVCLLER